MKQLEEMTSKELFHTRDNLERTISNLILIRRDFSMVLGKLEEIDLEITRRDNLGQDEVGFELVEDCCDECKWVTQIERSIG